MEELKRRLGLTRPNLIPLSTLNDCASHLQNAQNEFEAFFQNSNEAHLSNADVHMDSLLVAMRPLFPLPLRREAALAAEAAKDYAEQLLQLEASVRQRMNAVLTDIETQSGAISNTRASVFPASIRSP